MENTKETSRGSERWDRYFRIALKRAAADKAALSADAALFAWRSRWESKATKALTPAQERILRSLEDDPNLRYVYIPTKLTPKAVILAFMERIRARSSLVLTNFGGGGTSIDSSAWLTVERLSEEPTLFAVAPLCNKDYNGDTFTGGGLADFIVFEGWDQRIANTSQYDEELCRELHNWRRTLLDHFSGADVVERRDGL